MLDIGLTWEKAKQQCGEGTEDIYVIQPDNDAMLHTGLWNAYRAWFPNVQHDTSGLIPFIEGREMNRDTWNNHFENIDEDTLSNSQSLGRALGDSMLRHCSGVSVLTDELLPNALDVGVRTHKSITVLSYVGRDGGAYATEQTGSHITTGEILEKRRRGNRGKGVPQFLKDKEARFGVESEDDTLRTMLIRTIADCAELLLPHIETSDPAIVVDSTERWEADVKGRIDELRAKYSTKHIKHPVHERTWQLNDYEKRKQALVEQYRELAWEHVRAMYGSGQV